jgi:hypothetical protein
MKIIISESKFERLIEKKLDATLSYLKMDGESNPKDYTKLFSENIENIDGIKLMSVNVMEGTEMKFDIEVEVILDNDIAFGKWDVVDIILTEIAWILKEELSLKLKISLGKLTIKNKTTDW